MPVRGFTFLLAPLAGSGLLPPARPLPGSAACAGAQSAAVATSVAAIADARSRAAALMLAPSLDIGLAGGAAIPELAAIGQRDLLQQPPGLAAAQRRDDHGHHVALFDHVELPADAIEDAGARALDGVV